MLTIPTLRTEPKNLAVQRGQNHLCVSTIQPCWAFIALSFVYVVGHRGALLGPCMLRRGLAVPDPNPCNQRVIFCYHIMLSASQPLPGCFCIYSLPRQITGLKTPLQLQDKMIIFHCAGIFICLGTQVLIRAGEL